MQVRINRVRKRPKTGKAKDIFVDAEVLNDSGDAVWQYDEWLGEARTKLITSGDLTKAQAKKLWAAWLLNYYETKITPQPEPAKPATVSMGDAPSIVGDSSAAEASLASAIAKLEVSDPESDKLAALKKFQK